VDWLALEVTTTW